MNRYLCIFVVGIHYLKRYEFPGPECQLLLSLECSCLFSPQRDRIQMLPTYLDMARKWQEVDREVVSRVYVL